jgi:hypothetical protein
MKKKGIKIVSYKNRMPLYANFQICNGLVLVPRSYSLERLFFFSISILKKKWTRYLHALEGAKNFGKSTMMVPADAGTSVAISIGLSGYFPSACTKYILENSFT